MESSQENQNNALSSEQVEPQITATAEPVVEVEENRNNHSEEKNLNPQTDEDYDDSLDDLSAVEIATSLIDQNFSLDDPELVIPDHLNEAYKNIITVCNTTAQNIKKTISEVLNNSREGVVITEVDPTIELQESLNKKIADFEKVVSGSFGSSSIKTDVNAENSTGDANESVTIPADEDKDVETSNVKMTEDSTEQKPVGAVSNSKPTDNNSGDVNVKTDAKVSKSNNNKKRETTPEISDESTKMASALQLQTPDSLREMLKNACVSFEDEKLSKKQKNNALKKKGEKSIDQIMKSLGNGTTEEKLQLLCKRHFETQEEYRLVEPRLRQLERQLVSQQREKEQLQAEHNRMILAKSRLEGLCREMQRQSKAMKEENLLRIKEEEEKRKEIANKFQTTLNDISALMQENSKKNTTLREENAELAIKLKSLVENYEIWEQNMTKIVQQKELEAQLAKAKHAKVNLLLKQETEKFLREKQSLLENLSELQKKCTLLTSNELQLRTELGDYTSKYEEFQSVLSNSSKVFATFKNDMESTSKKIKKLEKETNVYKQKWESSNNALLDMISHKEKQDKEVANAQQRIQTLEKLCRALQAERNELRNQLNVQSSNTVSTPAPDVPSLSAETGVA